LAAIIEILDVVALDQGDNFDIIGGFKSTWRAHAWEGIDIRVESFCMIEYLDDDEEK